MESQYKKRIELVQELFAQLQNINKQLENYSQNQQKIVEVQKKKIFKENKSNIQAEIDKYNSNIIEIRKIDYDIINQINLWFEFAKDENNLHSLFFPLKYFFKKKALKNALANFIISKNTYYMENRFTKEKISSWQQSLKQIITIQVKKEDEFLKFEELTEIRKKNFDSLKYILSTIPNFEHRAINEDNLESIILTTFF